MFLSVCLSICPYARLSVNVYAQNFNQSDVQLVSGIGTLATHLARRDGGRLGSISVDEGSIGSRGGGADSGSRALLPQLYLSDSETKYAL